MSIKDYPSPLFFPFFFLLSRVFKHNVQKVSNRKWQRAGLDFACQNLACCSVDSCAWWLADAADGLEMETAVQGEGERSPGSLVPPTLHGGTSWMAFPQTCKSSRGPQLNWKSCIFFFKKKAHRRQKAVLLSLRPVLCACVMFCQVTSDLWSRFPPPPTISRKGWGKIARWGNSVSVCFVAYTGTSSQVNVAGIFWHLGQNGYILDLATASKIDILSFNRGAMYTY